MVVRGDEPKDDTITRKKTTTQQQYCFFTCFRDRLGFSARTYGTVSPLKCHARIARFLSGAICSGPSSWPASSAAPCGSPRISAWSSGPRFLWRETSSGATATLIGVSEIVEHLTVTWCGKRQEGRMLDCYSKALSLLRSLEW